MRSKTVLIAPCHQRMKDLRTYTGTWYASSCVLRSYIANASWFSNNTFSSQLTPPPNDPPSNAPWFFNRLRRYISSILTYLLTYLLTYTSNVKAKWKYKNTCSTNITCLFADLQLIELRRFSTVGCGPCGPLNVCFITTCAKEVMFSS